jgi:hypothetical protein
MSVRVGIVDSGVNAGHPHVAGVSGGVFIHADGDNDDYTDRIGHGTAVAGAIREKTPGAELYAVRIFDGRLTATIDALIQALEWCMSHGIDIVNVSVGTSNQEHRPRLENFVRRASEREMFVVSAAGLLPGDLPGAIAVGADPACDRFACRFRNGVFWASPYPRQIPGVPLERNLNGVSFAIANCTGLLARAMASMTPVDAYRQFRQTATLAE